MNHKSTQILILGAGYAGLMTALRLSGKTKNLNVQLTLVDASPVFIWLIFYFLVIERRFLGAFFWLGKNRYKTSAWMQDYSKSGI